MLASPSDSVDITLLMGTALTIVSLTTVTPHCTTAVVPVALKLCLHSFPFSLLLHPIDIVPYPEAGVSGVQRRLPPGVAAKPDAAADVGC